MQVYRLISSPSHQGAPVEVDLNKAPEFRAYQASNDEIIFVARPADIADLAKFLRSGGGAFIEYGVSAIKA